MIDTDIAFTVSLIHENALIQHLAKVFAVPEKIIDRVPVLDQPETWVFFQVDSTAPAYTPLVAYLLRQKEEGHLSEVLLIALN